MPKDYTENIKARRKDLYTYEYDFDNDGVPEKGYSKRKNDSILTREGLISIYTKQNNKYTLTYQIPIKNETEIFLILM